MIIRKRILGLLLATACSLGANAAMAADYEPPVFEAPAEDEYVPVEVGSGWYLRGDVAYSFQRDFKDSSVFADDFIMNDSLMPYNVGMIGLLDVFSFTEKDSPLSGGIGFGYHFNDYLRADVNIGILSSQRYSMSGHLWEGTTTGVYTPWDLAAVSPQIGCLGTLTTDDGVNPPTTEQWRRDCDISGQASQTMYDGMANLYVDLGTFAGITPYIGGGLGLLYSRNTLKGTASNCVNESVPAGGGVTKTFTCDAAAGGGTHDFTDVDKATYNLLYGASAGFAYKVSTNTSIDVGYSYRVAPNLEYMAISEAGLEKRKGYDIHQVKVGLRYDLW